MAATVQLMPSLAISVRNSFLHFMEDDASTTPIARRPPRARTGPASLFADALLPAALNSCLEVPLAPLDLQAKAEVQQEAAGQPLEQPAPSEQLPRLLGSCLRESGEPSKPRRRTGIQLDGEVAKIRVRNTFVHFADESDDEGEGIDRRARTHRTWPARFLEGAVPRMFGEESDPFCGAASSTDEDEACGATAAAGRADGVPMEVAGRALGGGWNAEPVGPPAKSALRAPGVPAPPLASPPVPESAEPAARLRLSVRNTFLHVDSDTDDDESPLGPHHRCGRRSKTGPPRICGFADTSTSEDCDSDPSSCGRAAEEAVSVSGALAAQEDEEEEEEEEELPVQAAEPRPRLTLSIASSIEAPATVGVPLVVQPQMVHAPFVGLKMAAPVLAPVAAQGVQCCAIAPVRTAAQPLEVKIRTQAPEPAGELEAKVRAQAAQSATASSAPQRGGDGRTTVVLKNLPLNYRRSMLLKLLDAEGFAGEYDYVYLPIDFKTRAGFGYAFINLVDPSVVPRFWNALDGYSRWMFPSAKVCSVSWSVPYQGLKSHIKRYRNSPLMHESVPDDYKPAVFSAGVRVAFPPPTKELAPPGLRVKGGAKGGRLQPDL